MLERPGVYCMGIEGTWYGVQPLDDNPYRTSSKPYVYMMAIAVKQFGPVELVATFENGARALAMTRCRTSCTHQIDAMRSASAKIDPRIRTWFRSS